MRKFFENSEFTSAKLVASLAKGETWALTFSTGPFPPDASQAEHSAAPCPAFPHFIQLCTPNRQRPLFTVLLHFFFMLKCQQIGLLSWVLDLNPFNSSGICGTGFGLLGFGRFEGGPGLSPSFSRLTGGAFGTATLGYEIKCTLILGSCMKSSKKGIQWRLHARSSLQRV